MVPVIQDENKEESEKETERQEGNQEKEVLLRYRKSEIKKNGSKTPHFAVGLQIEINSHCLCGG